MKIKNFMKYVKEGVLKYFKISMKFLNISKSNISSCIPMYNTLHDVHVSVGVADIVEKEFDSREHFDESNRLSTIPLKMDDVSSERSYERDFSFNDRHDDQADDRFNSQRENFANLYISGLPNDNDDVVYGEVPRRRQRIGAAFAANDFDHFTGDG